MSSDNPPADQPPDVPCDVWCSTDLNITKTSKVTFVWTIKGFKNKRGEYGSGKSITSRVFNLADPDGGYSGSNWVLEIYPNGEDYHSSSVVTYLRNTSSSYVSTKVELSYLDRSGNRKTPKSASFKCESLNSYQIKLLNTPFDNLNDDNTMPDGNLTLVCDLTTFGGKKTSYGYGRKTEDVPDIPKKLTPNVTKEQQVAMVKLTEDFQSLLLAKDLSDVQIKCGDETLDAHKAILSARSPVFGRMFASEMTEKKDKHVEIKELSGGVAVVKEMLAFIYTGSCAVTKENPDLELTADLLKAAERYQLESLKTMCGGILASKATAKNCLQVKSFSPFIPLLIVYVPVAHPWRHASELSIEGFRYESCH